MTVINPWRFGIVLSLTVVIGYFLCALFWYSFPGLAVALLNALFHGMDFGKIYTAAPFAIGSFLYALAALAIWAYALGAAYAAVLNLVLR